MYLNNILGKKNKTIGIENQINVPQEICSLGIHLEIRKNSLKLFLAKVAGFKTPARTSPK